MKRRQFMIAALAIGVSAHGASAAAPPNFILHDTPEPMPELQFDDATGNLRTLADFKGKVVLLNIWATWCVPCREEMPTLDRLQATLGGEDFEVVPVSIDRKGMAEVDKFYAEIGLQHLARYITPAANGALDQLGIFGIPASLLIDRQGRELGRLIGPAKWDSPDLVAFLKSIIAK